MLTFHLDVPVILGSDCTECIVTTELRLVVHTYNQIVTGGYNAYDISIIVDIMQLLA